MRAKAAFYAARGEATQVLEAAAAARCGAGPARRPGGRPAGRGRPRPLPARGGAGPARRRAAPRRTPARGDRRRGGAGTRPLRRRAGSKPTTCVVAAGAQSARAAARAADRAAQGPPGRHRPLPRRGAPPAGRARLPEERAHADARVGRVQRPAARDGPAGRRLLARAGRLGRLAQPAAPRSHAARERSSTCPASTPSSVLRTWTGFRPATPDSRPLVGAWEPRLWVAAGHEGLGITTAPGTGAAAVQPAARTHATSRPRALRPPASDARPWLSGSASTSTAGRSRPRPAPACSPPCGTRAFVTLRRSATGEPRGPLCGMGTCFECRVTIDGVPHRRSCAEIVRDGHAGAHAWLSA